MAKRMSDDEIMDYTYNKLFGDLDRIESGSMFEKEHDGLGAPNEPAKNAGEAGVAGMEITIKPLMKAAAEGGRPPEGGEPEPEDGDEEIAEMLKRRK